MSSQIRISAPSKVFLAGEYLALHGGASLVVNILPKFQMDIIRLQDGEVPLCPFQALSPAGLLWHQEKDFFKKYQINFVDPHAGAGGFGASSAQFLLMHLFWQMRDSLWVDDSLTWDLHSALRSYRGLGGAEQGYPPSGADLVAQSQGGLVFFDRKSGRLKKTDWIFPELGFVVAPTGFKVATHQHLSTLAEFEIDSLSQIMKKVELSLDKKDHELFLESLISYSDELDRRGWLCEPTKNILARLSGLGLWGRGCGALGADVVCIFYKKTECTLKQVLEKMKTAGLEPIASDHDLASGFFREMALDFSTPQDQAAP